MTTQETRRYHSEPLAMAKVLLANPRMLAVKPEVALFLARYMQKFTAKRFGRNLILHSHLPALTSPAYARFVRHHLVERRPGPSHAQIGLTQRCPQNCAYCYNKQRRGTPMSSDTIMNVIDDLKSMGVVWIGFTGGEPLLNQDIVAITAHASRDCAVKLFTTGCGLTPQRARDLSDAGLFSAAVSLDHWDAARHNAVRRYPEAFQAALEAIATFRAVPGLHVSVSSVVSREMIHNGDLERLIGFIESLKVDEAWLSEVKPSVEAFRHEELVITEAERQQMCAIQDAHNRRGGMTVNYLGHFEGPENFGCNAGCKMVYIDAFGDVSPCVFLPMTFGNVRERPLKEIVEEMRSLFPGESCCFVNRHFRLLSEIGGGERVLDRDRSIELLRRVRFGPEGEFSRRLYGMRLAA